MCELRAVQELIYAIRLPASGPARTEIADVLDTPVDKLPERIRLSTMAPLSNRGYPADAQAEVLSVRDVGLVIGVPNSQVPRMLVPWQNIAYLAEDR